MNRAYWMYLVFYLVGSFFGVQKLLGLVRGGTTAVG